MKCENNQTINGYGWRYKQNFNAWNYEYNEDMKNIEELAQGKTIFLLNRNNDSPNLPWWLRIYKCSVFSLYKF